MNIVEYIKRVPTISKLFINHYAPFRGAGIRVEKMDLHRGIIDIKMPLTRHNQNIVGVHFGGSLYAMVDPFYMLILMHKLGKNYIVWDKAASIQFLSPGRSTVSARIEIDENEVNTIRLLASGDEAVLRNYTLSIIDETGQRIAQVEKTVYIRKKKAKSTRSLFQKNSKQKA